MDATAYACRAGVLYVFAASSWSAELLRMAAAAPVRSMSLRRAAGATDFYVWRQLRRYAVCLCGELLEPRTATYDDSSAGTQYVFAASSWSAELLRMATAEPVCCMSSRRAAGAPDCYVWRQLRRYAVCLYGVCRLTGLRRMEAVETGALDARGRHCSVWKVYSFLP